MSFPPVTLITLPALRFTLWRRERSAVRPEDTLLTNGRNPAHTPVMSASVTPVVIDALSALST